MLVLASSFAGSAVLAHGGLTFPPPRNNVFNADPAEVVHSASGGTHLGGPCAGGECLWFNEGCFNGCDECLEAMPRIADDNSTSNYYGAPNCENPLEPTLPEEFRTWNIKNTSVWGDWTKYHPWRAPGRAPMSDPCGIAGGYRVPTGGGGETPVGGHPQGFPGSQLPKHENVTTQWSAGGVAEVGWMLAANHGGGYQYSLCPADENLTEACLNKMPLAYHGNTTTIRYIAGPQRGSELTIPAMDVSEGVFPEGAAWRRNPVPSCNCDKGFDCNPEGPRDSGMPPYFNGSQPMPKGFDCPYGTQFEVPFPYGYGQQLWNQGNNMKDPKAMDTWVLVDRVVVPEQRGDYVLRWRWDTEQNPQIWSHCADISIV